MRNENVFMSRKKQYGALPTGKKLKIRRPFKQHVPATKMERHDQRLTDRDIGNAWWTTLRA